MLCLGIETSCDDTSLALIENGRALAQVMSSQASLHALFGGVVPELASREHSRLIGPLFDSLFASTGRTPSHVDVVSVARGPGLLGSLLVGVSFAKAFAFATGATLIGVNHLHAHLMIAGLENTLELPALGVLVSGGHTHLYRIESPTEFISLGKTLDDAAGEAFDKAGKMLGLPYPAGRHIDELSRLGKADNKLFPRPYTDNSSLDFSFSGLKTALATYLAKHPDLKTSWNPETGERALENSQGLPDLCASYTAAVVDTLTLKTERALKAYPGCRSLVLAGGVAANSSLRQAMAELAKRFSLPFLVPKHEYCTDNAMMIAYLGNLLASSGYHHPLGFEAIPRGRAIPNDMVHNTRLASVPLS